MGMARRPHPLSPSDIDYQLYSPTRTSSSSSRDNSMPHHHHSNHHQQNSSHYSDSSTAMSHAHSVADPPIRGSGRKDRNRPERGSGRNHTPQMPVLVSASPELMMNGYATIPRASPSQHHGNSGEGGGAAVGHTPTNSMGVASLENLRLSDSECNAAFRRDNPGRISITKKSMSQKQVSFIRFIKRCPL